MANLLDREHYEGNVLDAIKELRNRIEALERTDLSGVAGPQGPIGPQGPQGPTGSPGPGAPSPLTQGDVLVVDSTPEITTLGIGNAHEILKVNAAGTDPAWEPFDWDEMSGVGGADMAHDHSAAAEGGATLNPTLVDLNGNADALVLDADGDTSISAPTDDEIDIEVAGSDIAEWKATGLKCASGVDLYPNGNEAGLQQRLDAYVSWNEHFDVASLPAGWAWAGAPFVTPATVSFAEASLLTIQNNLAVPWRGFLYRNESGGVNHALVSMAVLSVGTYVGIRWDDGTDNNYVEFVMNFETAVPTTWRYHLRWRTGGGAVNVASGSTVSTPNVMHLILVANAPLWTNWSISALCAGSLAVSGLTWFWQASGHPSGLTWTPTRQGIVVNDAVGASWFTYRIDAWV